MNIIKFNNNEQRVDKNGFKACFISSFFAIFICLVLLGVFALLLTYTSVPDTNIPLFSCLALYISAFGGGLMSALKKRSRGWFSGLVCGIMYVLIITIASGFIKDFKISPAYLLKLTVCCLLSVVGGIFSVNLPKRKKV